MQVAPHQKTMEGIQACSISTLEGRMLVSASAQTTLPMEFPLARLVAGLSPWLGDGDAGDVAVFGLRDHEVVIARGSRESRGSMASYPGGVSGGRRRGRARRRRGR